MSTMSVILIILIALIIFPAYIYILGWMATGGMIKAFDDYFKQVVTELKGIADEIDKRNNEGETES